MDLSGELEDIRGRLRKGSYANEAQVSTGVVQRLLRALGWDVYDPEVVVQEYAVGARRVDFALCDPPRKPKAFLEVKSVGQTQGADIQLFEYAFQEGVPFAILTDGQEWHFYLPAERGRYEERRVYKLDILERESQESAERLLRYLEYNALKTGAAIDAAKRDLQDVARERRIQETLPNAWRSLIEDQNEMLVELIADKVESLCGFEPSPESVGSFLLALPNSLINLKEPEKGPIRSTVGQGPKPKPDMPGLGFRLHDQFYHAHSARDVMIQVFEELGAKDATFFDRFEKRVKHGRRRRYLARDRSQLYPSRPDLEQHSHQLRSGWWIGTNYSKNSIQKIITMACEVAGIRFGKDLVVNLGQ